MMVRTGYYVLNSKQWKKCIERCISVTVLQMLVNREWIEKNCNVQVADMTETVGMELTVVIGVWN